MENKLTDNEIIKALECLHKRILKSSFAKYVTETEIMGLVDALDLINRKDAEIEGLQIRNKTLSAITKNYDWKFAKVKSEAIKEFAERLKINIFDDEDIVYENYDRAIEHIDNLVEVVRCKNCKYRYSYDEFDRDRQKTYKCSGCGILHKDVDDNAFCSYGERKENE